MNLLREFLDDKPHYLTTSVRRWERQDYLYAKEKRGEYWIDYRVPGLKAAYVSIEVAVVGEPPWYVGEGTGI